MCGIVGFQGPGGGEQLKAIGRKMADTLSHRGPDDSGVWVDGEAGMVLGHRRLSILDLSPLGHQPMVSSCGRYVVAYNGEIYNHLEIRQELQLEGCSFKGGSDTETMLAAISAWGLPEALGRFIGMFAFALWDREEGRLHLVRDRLGIKPMYYGSRGGVFYFASELKAIKAHPGFVPEIDRDVLTLLLRHNYIPSPYCIYRGLRKQMPGTVLTYTPGNPEVAEYRYWDVGKVWLDGLHNPFTGTEDEAAEALDDLLGDAVRKRMLSDVPIGAFLSGGVDSSLVTALMQKQSDMPVKTFCLGFSEADFDEAGYAAGVARHLGTEHVEQKLMPSDLQADIANFPLYWDEPFSDTGQLTAHMVSTLARREVSVCLSGDGGDELFLGYPRYFATRPWRYISRIPRGMRSVIRGSGRYINDRLSLSSPALLRASWRCSLFGSPSLSGYYRYLVSHNKYPEALVPGSREPENVAFSDVGEVAPQEAMPLWDLQGYLYDGILTKVDRASMATSLEVRVPILDHRVVEFAASIPLAMKNRGGGKHLLRRVLYKYVPRELVDRPKMGFGVPLVDWLKEDLRPWAEDLLDRNLLRRQGLLDPDKARSIWKAFLQGMPGGEYVVWDMLMFQAWLMAQDG